MDEYNFDAMIQRLKIKKKESSITNIELAEKSGVPLGTVNRVFAGQTREPQLNTIIKLSSALGVTSDYIIYGEKKEKPVGDATDKLILELFGELTHENKKKVLELAKLYVDSQETTV